MRLCALSRTQLSVLLFLWLAEVPLCVYATLGTSSRLLEMSEASSPLSKSIGIQLDDIVGQSVSLMVACGLIFFTATMAPTRPSGPETQIRAPLRRTRSEDSVRGSRLLPWDKVQKPNASAEKESKEASYLSKKKRQGANKINKPATANTEDIHTAFVAGVQDVASTLRNMPHGAHAENSQESRRTTKDAVSTSCSESENTVQELDCSLSLAVSSLAEACESEEEFPQTQDSEVEPIFPDALFPEGSLQSQRRMPLPIGRIQERGAPPGLGSLMEATPTAPPGLVSIAQRMRQMPDTDFQHPSMFTQCVEEQLRTLPIECLSRQSEALGYRQESEMASKSKLSRSAQLFTPMTFGNEDVARHLLQPDGTSAFEKLQVSLQSKLKETEEYSRPSAGHQDKSMAAQQQSTLQAELRAFGSPSKPVQNQTPKKNGKDLKKLFAALKSPPRPVTERYWAALARGEQPPAAQDICTGERQPAHAGHYAHNGWASFSGSPRQVQPTSSAMNFHMGGSLMFENNRSEGPCKVPLPDNLNASYTAPRSKAVSHSSLANKMRRNLAAAC